MKVIFGFRNLSSPDRASAVTIGIFDGVHRAHARILKRTVFLARREHLRSICITFWPHPKGSPFLYSLEHRISLIKQFGFDVCLVVSFTPAFARTSADYFVRRVLVDTLRMKRLVVGENFRFGKKSEAGAVTLRQLSSTLGFSLELIRPMRIRGVVISSTQIRDRIMHGKLAQASKLLGRPVSVYGKVVRGLRVGRLLGYPTANIDPHHEVIPPGGVYAVKVRFGTTTRFGACYIGRRSSISRITRPSRWRVVHSARTIEVHIFGFSGDLYRRHITIEFLRRLRAEKRFSSPAALVAGITADISRIKQYLHLA